ncbi:MAG: ABC transporter permease [Planctomycetota bacterium]|nr:MAG: ABC transporter permease [Planctomycetota bacterium]
MHRIFHVTGDFLLRLLTRALQRLRSTLYVAGYTVFLFLETLGWSRRFFSRFRETVYQMYLAGVESLPVVLLVGAFSGMVLSLQSGLTLRSFGAEELVGVIVPLAMMRQMAPIMTALILAGRVGSSMAAEIGTMAVSEELDALEVMSINPVRYLVMPRFWALTIMAPMLTLFAAVVGTAAAGMVADWQVGLDFQSYWQNVLRQVRIKDVCTGLSKALVFGMFVSIICCSEGLRTSGGAAGVGESTRRSVVVSFICVIIVNYFMTSIIQRLFY